MATSLDNVLSGTYDIWPKSGKDADLKTDDSGDISKDLKASLASEKAERKAAYDPVIEKLNKNAEDIGNVKPAAPPTLEPYPEQKPTDPMEAWGSPAMWMATFGSLLTRAPLTSALNAAAGVNNAYAANDAEAYKKEVEKWKFHNDNAIKMADYEQKRYDDEIKGLKDRGEDYYRSGELLSKELGNSTAETMMKLRIDGYHDKMFEHNLKLQSTQQDLVYADKEQQKAEDAARKAGKPEQEIAEIGMKAHREALGEAYKQEHGKGEGSSSIDASSWSGPKLTPAEIKERTKIEAKNETAYNINREVADNALQLLDSVENNLSGPFKTGGAMPESRAAFARGRNYLGLGDKAEAEEASNLEKDTNNLVLEMNKFQQGTGARSSVLGLKTALASKPGIGVPEQTNRNIIAETRGKIHSYLLGEELANAYKESSPYGVTDSRYENLERALKEKFPIIKQEKDGRTEFNQENVEKFRQAIPDAIANPDKYLKGGSQERYGTKEDIKAAFKRNEISREEAKSLLKSHGYE